LGVDWAVLPTPSVPTPDTGVCTAAEGTHTVGPVLDFLPGTVVDCSQPHLTETFHIGVFPPDVDTDPNTVPPVGGARFRYAYTARWRPVPGPSGPRRATWVCFRRMWTPTPPPCRRSAAPASGTPTRPVRRRRSRSSAATRTRAGWPWCP